MSLGCLLMIVGILLPFLGLLSLGVFLMLENAIGTFGALVFVIVFLVAVGWLVRNIVKTRMRD